MKNVSWIAAALVVVVGLAIFLAPKNFVCPYVEAKAATTTSAAPAQPGATQPPLQAPEAKTEGATAKPTEHDQAYERKTDLVNELKADAEWYNCESDFYGLISVFFTILIAIATAATAFLIAIDFAKDSTGRRAFLTGLPILSGLMTTLLSQYHVQELWRLREVGRIQSLSLMDEVHALPTASTDVRMRTILLKFQKKQRDIQREQATAFFSYVFTNTSAPADPKQTDGNPPDTTTAPPEEDPPKTE